MYEKIDLEAILLNVTKKCNLNCEHCFNSGSQVGEADMSIELIEKVIDIVEKFNAKTVFISGGEPFLYCELNRLLEIIKKKSEIIFCFTTNGTLLNQNIINKLEHLSYIAVQVSVDGATKSVYEKQRGLNTYNNFEKGLKLLANSKIKNKKSRTAISKYNYKDIKNICRLMCEYEFEQSYLFVNRLGNAKENWEDLVLTDFQKINVYNTINNLNKQYSLNIVPPKPTTACVFTKQKERKVFTIEANGDVLTCNYFYDYPIGNILYDKFENILRGEKLKKLYDVANERANILKNTEKCKSCIGKIECKFGCIGVAKVNENILGYDEECNLRNIYIVCQENTLM